MSRLCAIRDASRDDVPFLVESNYSMALETEGKSLDRDVLERGTRAVFDHPDRGFYLIAERDGRPAACLLVTREWSDWRDGDWWWLQSVYVLHEARRSGMFRAMFAEVERRSLTAGCVGLRLYVDSDNVRAQQTYRVLGMTPARYQFFEKERRREIPPEAQSQ